MGVLGDLKAYLAEKLDIHVTSHNKSQKKLFTNKIKATGEAKIEQTINVFNLANSTKEEKEEVLKLLGKQFEDDNILFISDEQKRLADSVVASEKTGDNGELVAFFEDKLTPKDWQIFRTGLYITFLMSQGMPTSQVRQSVIAAYGKRERNLLNLASSGHFATHIKPMYQDMSRAPGFTNTTFYKELDRILEEMPFAIFVNHGTTSYEIAEMVKERVEATNSYSVEERKIYIHGWGDNVKTVEDAIEELDDSIKVDINKRKEVTEIIDATLSF